MEREEIQHFLRKNGFSNTYIAEKTGQAESSIRYYMSKTLGTSKLEPAIIAFIIAETQNPSLPDTDRLNRIRRYTASPQQAKKATNKELRTEIRRLMTLMNNLLGEIC